MAKAWLLVEWLENRTAPANFGIPWQDPSHITLSFVPDGTVIAGHTSNLFAVKQDNLYPVMLHDAGHVIGFGTTPDDPTMQPMLPPKRSSSSSPYDMQPS